MKAVGLSGRTLGSVVALCLPTVAVVAFGVYFLLAQVPTIVKNERQRVRAVYREAAEELRAAPEKGFPVVRGKGPSWAKDMKMSPGYWGVVPSGGEVLVWYAEGDKFTGKTVEAEREIDYFHIFWHGVPLFLFVLCGMTFVGVKYFVGYVRSRDDFLAATAHDLTTPLVGMRYSIGRCDDEAKVLNERLIRLVGNIKDFMKLGGRRPAPKSEPFDVVKAYGEAYAIFRDDYRELFDGEDVPVEDEGVPHVVGDETMTVQILWNLLGNDLKYAAPHGAVRVRFSVDGKFVKVEFSDEGQGMTPRQMRRAFDRYYRAKTVLESGKGGFGIGLCTAREFAEAMGGSLTIRANSPRGCVFALSLPASAMPSRRRSR